MPDEEQKRAGFLEWPSLRWRQTPAGHAPPRPDEITPDPEFLEPEELKHLDTKREFQGGAIQSPERSGFATGDEALAWVRYRDKASVDRVAPELGCITFEQLNWRRAFNRLSDAHRREWRNMSKGGDLSSLFALPLPEPVLKEIGSPADLYAVCKAGEVTAWGRYRGGKLEQIPFAEWIEGIPPKDWTDLRYGWAELYRFFPVYTGSSCDAPPALSDRPTQEDIAEPKAPEIPTLSDRAAVRGPRPLDERSLRRYVEQIKEKGGPIPARAKVVTLVCKDFPNNHVTCRPVEEMHIAVFGRQSRGPRRNNLTENSAK